MNNPNTGNLATRTRRNTANLGLWTGAWLITMAVSVFGPLLLWDGKPTLSAVTILVNVLVGAGMILANKRHLEGLDEMHQKIQLEAMALSLGVALVAGLAYSTADITNLIAFDAEISHLVFLIGITYGVGVALGRRKYQ